MDSTTVLSDLQIEKEIKNGNIIYISPTNKQISCGNCSVDLTLGENYFTQNISSCKVLNPWNPKNVRSLWGEPKRATTVAELCASETSDFYSSCLEGLKPCDKIILLRPGENILAHSDEFIGGRKNITTMMKSRSSIGRNFISVCNDAGWGDVGYINRWTMEISNSNKFPVILVVGERIAQLVFQYTGPVKKEYSGSYQNSNDIDHLVTSWTPDSMLPKLNR